MSFTSMVIVGLVPICCSDGADGPFRLDMQFLASLANRPTSLSCFYMRKVHSRRSSR